MTTGRPLKHLVSAGLCDNGGGPGSAVKHLQGLTTQLKPVRRRAVMAVRKRIHLSGSVR